MLQDVGYSLGEGADRISAHGVWDLTFKYKIDIIAKNFEKQSTFKIQDMNLEVVHVTANQFAGRGAKGLSLDIRGWASGHLSGVCFQPVRHRTLSQR